MTEAQRRIAEQQSKSGINKLWDALTPLKHVGSFMNCGAHPDDERSHILAYLARNQGVRVIVDDFREQARAYKGKRSKPTNGQAASSLLSVWPSGSCRSAGASSAKGYNTNARTSIW